MSQLGIMLSRKGEETLSEERFCNLGIKHTVQRLKIALRAMGGTDNHMSMALHPEIQGM